MKLSVLDQVPLTDHVSERSAACISLNLAQAVDQLGYHRIWYAEHHRSASFACGAPEIMAALALERTTQVRVGTGGILLPLTTAEKASAVMQLLTDSHPGRVDIGVGRAAYEDPNYAARIRHLVRAASVSDGPLPPVWVLGAGGSSAPLAGQLGAGYVHGHFFNPRGGEAAMVDYAAASTHSGHAPQGVLAVRIITAATPTRVKELLDAVLLWRVRKDHGVDGPIPSFERARSHEWTESELSRARAREKGIVHGTPEAVRAQLVHLAQSHGVDEIMINTLTSDPRDRLAIYELLADAFTLKTPAASAG